MKKAALMCFQSGGGGAFNTAAINAFLAPTVTLVETKGAMDSAFVGVFTSSFAYTFVRKKARITLFGMWVTSRWIMLKYNKVKIFLF